MGGESQGEEAASAETRRKESEHETSAYLHFPPLQDGTESTAWYKRIRYPFLHFGAVLKPQDVCFYFRERARD